MNAPGWCLLAALLASAAHARSNGIAGYSGRQGSTCNSCHSGGTAPMVTISGPTSVVAGSTNSYTVTLTGGAASAAGMNASVNNAAATLSAGDDTKVLNGEIVHSAATLFANGTATFTFRMYAPPTASSLTVYASGNSTNGAGNTAGDRAASTTLMVTVMPAPMDAGTPAPDEPDAGPGTPDETTADSGVDPGGAQEEEPPPETPAPDDEDALSFGEDYPVPTKPTQQGTLVEGQVGCASVGGLPKALLLAAVALIVLLRRDDITRARRG